MRANGGFLGSDKGQSVVIVALMFAILCGFAALSVDVGRFYAERRFLQDAVDAAALACARSYAVTSNAATAWSAGDAVLQNRNLKGNPLGLTITYAARGSETYDNNVVAPQNLNSGILPVNANGVGCRVAITVAVPTYLIKIVSSSLNTITMTTRGYAKAKGGLLPSVVKRYENTSDNDAIDSGSPNEFIDHVMASGFDHTCTVSNPAGCTPASLAAKGREFVMMGASQKANNDSSFRGYIGLDIRDFSTEDGSGNLVHEAYNGVAQDATVNTLKDYEAQWITNGYPGPDICVVDPANFDPCAQIAAINGSSSGIFVDYYDNFFQSLADTSTVGDIVLLQLYDGTVKTVPDFTINPPILIVPASGAVSPITVPYSMSSQFASSSSNICTEVIPDNGSATNGSGDTSGSDPFVSGAIPLVAGAGTCTGLGAATFASNPTPSGSSSYNQTWTPGTAVGAQQGIYTVFLKGEASAPYTSRIHTFPVKVVVAGQTRDYDTSGSTTQQSVSTGSLPATVNFTANVATGNGSNKWRVTGGTLDGNVTVKWESCPRDAGSGTVLTCYIGSPGTTSSTIAAGNTVNLTVSTSGVQTQTTYTGWVRTTGMSAGGHPVTHVWEVKLDVDQATGGTTDYVDVIGYAAFEITQITSNDIYGRAVTGAYYDPNDPALAIAKKIVLVPWETP